MEKNKLKPGTKVKVDVASKIDEVDWKTGVVLYEIKEGVYLIEFDDYNVCGHNYLSFRKSLIRTLE